MTGRKARVDLLLEPSLTFLLRVERTLRGLKRGTILIHLRGILSTGLS